MHIHRSAWKHPSEVKSWPLAPLDYHMESLGAAAAISQFLIQFIATVDLAKRLKGSSQSLKRYQEQLEDLRGLCEDISSNPALRTDEVKRETQSILHTISTHKDISSLLEKGRIHRSIAFILKERSFGDLFATLENKKTNLTLRVQHINCLAVHDLHLQVTSMSASNSLLDHLIRICAPCLPISVSLPEQYTSLRTTVTSAHPNHGVAAASRHSSWAQAAIRSNFAIQPIGLC